MQTDAIPSSSLFIQHALHVYKKQRDHKRTKMLDTFIRLCIRKQLYYILTDVKY